MGYQFISWNQNDEITSAKLNAMVDNDDFLHSRRADSVLTNVDPSTHLPVPNAPLLTSNLVVFGGYSEFFPNLDDGVSASAVDVTINFPQGLFDPVYQPTIAISIGHPAVGNGTTQLGVSIREIDFASFTAVVRSYLPSILLDNTQLYFLTYMAIGVAGGITQ